MVELKDKYLVPLLVAVFLLAACKKTDTTKVPGNVPPPDHTIDSSTINIYVNKSYINLLGRKAVGDEQSTAVALLRTHNFSIDDRKAFIQTLFSKVEYNRNLYGIANNQYLRNVDSFTIAEKLFELNYDLTLPLYAQYYDYINYEIGRLNIFKGVLDSLNLGKTDYRGMLVDVTNNYFYDQINMGTQNFVISTYQNYLFRYPDSAEVANGSAMVDGNSSIAFYQHGQSKMDYINIFFHSNDYYEGQVRFIFKLYLFREPTSAEIAFYSNIYKSTGDYKQLQLAVFSLDEYAGVH